MVYDWDDKEELCYRMYIEEKKSLEEIMEYMKNERNFAPSKRAFQVQFKRWEFPSKQNPAHKNEQLVNRVKELWEKNTSQRDMLRILNEVDGFDIKERELMRVRAKNRWLLRVPNGGKGYSDRPTVTASRPAYKKKRPRQSGDNGPEQVLFPADKLPDLLGDRPQPPTPPTPVVDPQLEAMAPPESHGQHIPEAEMLAPSPPPETPLPQLTPEEEERRRLRMEKLQAESEEKWSTRKRRRRTRGWAGLPADPPGPPRFPSETTLDESKVILNLSVELYREIRERFQVICEETGIQKKTASGPERWQAAKDRLVHESPHLQTVFWGPDPSQNDTKALALDVVCTDVTKRMRTMDRRMTIAEAKNILGINPEQSRQIRDAFYQALKADHFTSKLEAGEAHWQELKDQWIAGSELLTNIVAPGDADPDHQKKLKALEVLCRDVMKRLGDDQRKLDPHKKKQKAAHTHTEDMAVAAMNVQPDLSSQQEYGPQQQQYAPQHDHGDMQIDPSLLLAANDPSLAMDQQLQQQLQHHAAGNAYVPPSPLSIPAWFRISPHSQLPSTAAPRLWLATLTSLSVHELRDLAISKHPGATLERVQGMVKDSNSGHEIYFAIDEEDELEAYLEHVGHGHGKATFLVQLMGQYA